MIGSQDLVNTNYYIERSGNEVSGLSIIYPLLDFKSLRVTKYIFDFVYDSKMDITYIEQVGIKPSQLYKRMKSYTTSHMSLDDYISLIRIMKDKLKLKV